MNTMLKITALCAMLSLLAMPALAADSLQSFDLVIKNHKFEPSTITIPADTKVKLLVKNNDADVEEFDSTDLSREKVIAGNSQGTVMVGPLKAGTYKFRGEYHEETAKGQIIAK